MSREVGIRELKNGASALIECVESGEVITVTRHGKPVARLIPSGMPPEMAQLVAEGRVQWSGRKAQAPRTRVKLRGKGKTAAEYVAEGRR